MSKINFSWRKTACAALLLCAATAIASQTFTTLVNFDGTDGLSPFYVSLVQGTDGNLYGTASSGGANGLGTVFKMTPTGTLTTLHSFAGSPTDGASPYAGLVLGTDSNFYGATEVGGAHDHGTVFKITSGGTLNTLHSFGFSDGANPYGGLIQATDGNLYGTTYSGGANGFGTVFKITGGTVTTLHSFDSNDGASPVGALIQGTDGNFYGTTYAGGGSSSDGIVFKITSGGTLTTLHSFDGTDGAPPSQR